MKRSFGDLFFGYFIIPFTVVTVIGCFVALPFAIYNTWSHERSPVIRIFRADWECTKTQIYRAGKSFEQQCARFDRVRGPQ